MLHIDGSQGEGGGQVLRTTLALSLITGQAVCVTRIRAGRAKPGLRSQHLTAVQAAAAIGGAEVTGAGLGSGEITFAPRGVRAGDYTFRVGTAGSTTLVLQTVLPPLLLASEPSTLTLEGGTHNPKAPPFDFLEKTFLPIVNRMGPTVSARLERHGFFPAGGGKMTVRVSPAEKLAPIELLERGAVRGIRGRILITRIPRHVAEREADTLCKKLGLDAADVQIDEIRAVRRYLDAGVPVGECLADQLLLPLAIAGGGSFRTLRPSLHAETNAQVIRGFLDRRIECEELPDGTSHVRVVPA
jgi:RNA 3'-terminal phosphate cyclase (ATP)